jgi:hypothetical protein
MKEQFIHFFTTNKYILLGITVLFFTFFILFVVLPLKIEGLLTENPFIKVSDISYTLAIERIGDASYVNYQIGNKVNYGDLSYSLNNPKILPLTQYNTSFNDYYYDPNNYGVEYHDGNNSDNKYKTKDSGTWVKNPSGKLEYIKWIEMPKYPTYYVPGSLPFGPSTYVPSYEDTVYLKYNKNLAKNS